MLFLAAVAGHAEASSSFCRELRGQLVAVSAKGSSPLARKYERAAREQREQIAIASRDARRFGCTSRRSAQCDYLMVTLDRMKRNLGELERQRDRLDGGTSAHRTRILAALKANGCDQQERQARTGETRSAGRRVTILDQIFEDDSRRRAPLESKERSTRVRTILESDGGATIGDGSGSFRTLCVRTCDGYYFPISFAATRNDFDRDLKACEAMCPGTEVDLYYHSVPEQESEEMVSISGVPYTELPNAFLYRKIGYKRPESCGCKRERNFEIIAGEPGRSTQAPETVDVSAVPVPTPRPDPTADPETIANRDGDLMPGTIETDVGRSPQVDAPDEDAERRIRVVGPAFLPDPEAEADPQAPDPMTVR